MVDIYYIFDHAFSEKAKVAMSNKIQDLVYQYNEKIEVAQLFKLLGRLGFQRYESFINVESEVYLRQVDLVHFIARSATKEDLPKAIESVIATVNHVADLNFTKASLVQLGVIEMHRFDKIDPEFAVFSYITLTQKGSDYVKQNLSDMFISEGGVPKRI